jgi:hypothetical protein
MVRRSAGSELGVRARGQQSLLVGILAVPHSRDKDTAGGIIDFVDHAIIANSDPVGRFRAGKLSGTSWARVDFQTANGTHDAFHGLRW